jgi:hypothetical protein
VKEIMDMIEIQTFSCYKWFQNPRSRLKKAATPSSDVRWDFETICKKKHPPNQAGNPTMPRQRLARGST